MRATEALAEAMQALEPDEVIGSYECQRCRTRYVITAAAYQQAA